MKDRDGFGQMLEGYEAPAILVTKDYEIIATNSEYEDKFGQIDLNEKPRCFSVSHGYDKPCDQAGEDCPLLAAKTSGKREKVLHIHQSPNGPEHVDVEMVPIFDNDNQLSFFIELLKPVPLASGATLNKQIVGKSPVFKKLLETATRVAKTEADILLLGESGTGKELISRLIHLSSVRKEKPMVTLECSGLSEALIESELFGHKKGAFTGAHNDKVGLVEQANGGTLFLDEIGDISLETQVKLLRLIETKTFRRVGSTEVRTSDFRLICATHRDLSQMVNNGSFRLDLYHRINVFPITVPSLAERLEDLPELVTHMLKTSGKNYHITEGALSALRKHRFAGNIRELRNIITRAIILCDSNIIDTAIIEEALALDNKTINGKENNKVSDQGHKEFDSEQTLKQIEADYLQHLLEKHQGNKEQSAKAAGISLRTLYRKLR